MTLFVDLSEFEPNSAFVPQKVQAICQIIDQIIDEKNRFQILGDGLAPQFGRPIGNGVITTSAVIRVALLVDCLRVTEMAIIADGKISLEEIQYSVPLVLEAAPFLAQLRDAYGCCWDHFKPTPENVRDFLEYHRKDKLPFGGACHSTEWLGLNICYRTALLAQDEELLKLYEQLMDRLVSELITFGGITPEEDAQARQLRALFAEKLNEFNRARGTDLRILAFCSPQSQEVFHTIAQSQELARPDPYDVELIHASTRGLFRDLVNRITSTNHSEFGRILLIKGKSGDGKTHLMRAFRNYLHSRRLGYAGYMQMSSMTSNYGRYMLLNLLQSLEQPYDAPEVRSSGLLCLSDALLEAAQNVAPEQQETLRNGSLTDEELSILTSQLADIILQDPRFEKLSIDFVRVMLCLQRRYPPLYARALKYLRCEPLNAYDQRLLGQVAPQCNEEDPLRMIEQLGRLIWNAEGGALVLLVDQLEDIFNFEDSTAQFRRAMDAIRHITDHLPSCLVVISCLEDYYIQLRPALTRAVLDRIESDPNPVTLHSQLSVEEIEAIIIQRLRVLYESAGARLREDDPLFPFDKSFLPKLASFRTRDILDWCREHQSRCIAEGKLVPLRAPDEGAAPAVKTTDLARTWNDHRTQFDWSAPDQDSDYAALLAWGIQSCSAELDSSLALTSLAQDSFVNVQLTNAQGSDKLLIGICNRAPQGGGLGTQVAQITSRARDQAQRPVLVRCSDFPQGKASQISKQIGQVITSGGRRVVMEDSAWRTIAAFQAFSKKHGADTEFANWRSQERPLGQLEPLRQILGLDNGGFALAPAPSAKPNTISIQPPPAPAPAPKPPASQPRVSTPPRPSGLLTLGRTRALLSQPVTLSPEQLKMHAAFLGSTGSGKTTVALNLIEQLAMQGVPSVLLDRKGDLCAYASSDFAQDPSDSIDIARRKQALCDKLDVRVYTPGTPAGRSLYIPIVPSQLSELSVQDRSQLARYAAAGLGAMMGYHESSSDQARRGILAKTMEILGQAEQTIDVGIENLVSLIDQQDPSLVDAVGKLDKKHFAHLVDHLETLRLNRGYLLERNGEPLTPEMLFGLDGSVPQGKTRLTIISTKFLGDNANIEFWVSRLLVEVGHWASKHPSSQLQALMLFDEADLYLPAQRKPATKEPMEDLLKRGRSAGIGVLLATQSPGDLDYKCRDNIRTWLVGRIAEKTAVDKMRPLLSDAKSNVASKLANLAVGEFFQLSEGTVIELKADPSLLRTKQLPENEILSLAQG